MESSEAFAYLVVGGNESELRERFQASQCAPYRVGLERRFRRHYPQLVRLVHARFGIPGTLGVGSYLNVQHVQSLIG